MVDTVPIGNPFSEPQKWCEYCDTIGFGSVADAETMRHTTPNKAVAHLHSQRLPRPPSRKVFKLLNDDLAGLLQRIFVAGDDVKYQTELCLTRRRYARGELMLRNHRRSSGSGSSAEGLETHTSRLPAHQIRESA